jgi:hypothetical protein
MRGQPAFGEARMPRELIHQCGTIAREVQEHDMSNDISSHEGSKGMPAVLHVPSHGHGYLRPVRPGEVRNPTGKGGLWREAQRITREKSAEAARRLVELMYSDDDRVALMASVKVMVWSWGKSPEYDPREDRPATEINTSIMSPEERALLLGLVRRGLLVPSEHAPGEAVPMIDAAAER